MATNSRTIATGGRMPRSSRLDRPGWTFLNDLELPPAVIKDVEDRCRRQGYSSAPDRRHVEQEIMLQHFFGGQNIAYLDTSDGLVIVAAGDMSSAAFASALDALSAEERRHVTLYSPDPWNSPATTILTQQANEA